MATTIKAYMSVMPATLMEQRWHYTGDPAAVLAVDAVDEAKYILTNTEPETHVAWHVNLGKGTVLMCGPLSDPWGLPVDAVVAEAIAAFLPVLDSLAERA